MSPNASAQLDRKQVQAIGDEIAELAGHIHCALHRLFTLIRAFDEHGGWHAQGALTCAEWLSWRIGLEPGAAREHVRVAKALGELPRIDDALRRGVLSYSKVRALTRVARPENEKVLLDLAEQATASQLEKVCRRARAAMEANGLGGLEQRLREESRTLRQSSLASGMVKLEVTLHPEEAALLMKAVDAARSELYRRPAPDVPAGTAEQKKATACDAVLLIADSFLASGGISRTGGDRAQLVVHTELSTLTGAGDAVAELEDGTPLSREAALRMACDASVVEMVEDCDGKVLSVGRKTRTIPPAIRRALLRRDGACCRSRGAIDTSSSTPTTSSTGPPAAGPASITS